ncbi:hypothetical protein QJS10_CPB13g00080 [Acorus calamus]|uniref:Uncharacterized protein n=1 Tax=Acorus calamus TaxID=4465 RepID=A0AAV9DGD8_ACOCL|nr:hypothetical protein QJS10_CPB13g00080 [Acorus calamus]
MAIQAEPSPVRRLFELLKDQQEPFLLDIYLLENGFLNKLRNLETSPRCWPCSSPTKSLQRSLSHGLKQRREEYECVQDLEIHIQQAQAWKNKERSEFQ